jgi:signal recognition particle GTPase
MSCAPSRSGLSPAEVLLVVDAMIGQEAVNIAKGFREPVALTGLILTKMDGDARGGAAISIRSVTGVPIKFLGTGEGLDAIEVIRPQPAVFTYPGNGRPARPDRAGRSQPGSGEARKRLKR